MDGAGAGRGAAPARLTPDVAGGVIRLEQPLTGNAPGLRLRATLSDADGLVASAECAADLDLAPRLDLHIPERRRRLWKAGDPHLYDVAIALVDGAGTVVDEAASYTALRAVSIDGRRSGSTARWCFSAWCWIRATTRTAS